MSSGLGSGWRLRNWRTQTVMACIALAVAVSLPVVLLSVGGGVSDHVLNDLQSSGFQISLTAPGTHGISRTHDLVAAIGHLAHVGEVSPVLSVSLDLFRSTGGPLPVLCEGVLPGPFVQSLPPDQRALFPSPLPFSDGADSEQWDNGSYSGPAATELMVSSPIANAYQIRVGDTVRLAPTSTSTNSTALRVVGTFGVPPALLGPTGAFAVIVPLAELQVLTGNARNSLGGPIDAADSVDVGLAGSAARDPGTVAEVARQIQSLYPFYSVTTQSQTVDQERSSAAILMGFYLALSSASVAVGLFFLALVLVRRVEAMRSTIAIRRAIGEPARFLGADLAGQGLMLGGFGALGGLALGYVTVRAIAAWGTAGAQDAAQLAVFDPVVLAALLGAVVALGVASSLLATRAALRVPITEALR
ncbi:MAG TPA: ABC transporter permease [Thermoplasmata archaeon]|nr:ABC transporter permease [Thermoplasmata archaeon]